MTRGGARRSPAPWPKRLAWLLGLWLLGVCALGAAAIVIKLVMRFAGLTS